MRDIFVKTLVELAKRDERIFLITADLGFSVLEEFEEKFPNRFLNVGIAEANAVGIAAGLALSGKIVYVYSIIPFVTMRPFEQIRVDVAYMNANVRLVGVGAGLSYGAAGATHHSIEDIAIMRALPNMSVFSPCNPFEVENITRESVTYRGPIYFRLAKNGEPIIVSQKKKMQLGEVNIIKENKDSNIVVLFTGNSSDIALKVEKELFDCRVDVELTSIYSLKPFDEEYINKMIATKKYIFTIEEHSIIGGLGSIVAEYIAESKFNPKFKRFALLDKYSHYVGDQKFIRKQMNLTSKNIVKNIKEILINEI